jgi:hypothetical protein
MSLQPQTVEEQAVFFQDRGYALVPDTVVGARDRERDDGTRDYFNGKGQR